MNSWGDSLFRLSTDAIIVGDENGVIRRINPAVVRFSGFTEDELVGSRCEQFVHPKDLPVFRSGLERVFQGQVVKGYGIRALHKRGSFIRQEWSGSLLENGDFVTVGKVPKRRSAIEVELKESEARFRRLAENAADMIYRMSLPDGRYEYVSPAANELFGYSPREFYENPLLVRELLPPAWHGYFARQWECLLDGQAPPTYEYPIIHRSGEMRWLNQRNVLVRGANGRPVAIEGIVTDVTARKRAEEEARLHAEGFQTLLTTTRDGFARVGLDGRLLEVSDAYAQMTGYTRDELLQLEIADIDVMEAKADVDTRIEKIVRNGFDRFETRHRRKDGEILLVEVSASYWASKREFLIFVRDVSEARQAEAEVRQLNATLERRVAERTGELETANRELEAFSYSVSHDLRGPLRALNGFAEVLREDYGECLDEAGHGYLGRIRDASTRMAELVDAMLGFSRLLRSELEYGRVALDSLAGELVEELEAAHPERSVEWRIEPDLNVSGDPRLLRSLLQNLLGNAMKFTAEREPACIALGLQRRDGAEVFFVRDNGAGFDMADSHRLFQPFERLHTEMKYKGTGIGLATVQRIVQRHGGRVWAEGSVDRGATFYFTLGEAPGND